MKQKHLFGVLLIAIGIGFLLDQFNIISFGRIFSMYWPLIIILIGVSGLFDRKSSKFGNSVIIIVGVILQINALDILNINVFGLIFPLILILSGINVIFSRQKHLNYSEKPLDESHIKTDDLNKNIDLENNIDAFALMSGIETNNRSQEFRGGKATAIMGGIEIDLRGAKPYNDVCQLELNVVMGSIELIVPDEWRVEVSGVPLLGEISNKSRYNVDSNAPILKVKGFVIMGAIEIK